LKSGHDTYEAAEKAALAIKKRHAQLHVTVYTVKDQRHTTIEQPRPAHATNKNRPAVRAARNTLHHHHTGIAGANH
jgi:hypothetical protein